VPRGPAPLPGEATNVAAPNPSPRATSTTHALGTLVAVSKEATVGPSADSLARRESVPPTQTEWSVVDISIRNPANLDQVLWDEAPKMTVAMRRAGFAAWYRPTGMLGPDSGAHVHAIAVGDPELSEAARRQLDGPEGYFRGLDGVPPEYQGPHPDPHGGPVICPWMIEMGYKNLR
jgi:hypothetical protein